MEDKCTCNVIHEDVIKNVKEHMHDEDILFELGEFFKLFGDSTRVRILYALSISEMCVCDLSTLLGMTQSAISHQLKILRQSKIVKYRKEGKVVYYSLDDDHITGILEMGREHLTE